MFVIKLFFFLFEFYKNVKIIVKRGKIYIELQPSTYLHMLTFLFFFFSPNSVFPLSELQCSDSFLNIEF